MTARSQSTSGFALILVLAGATACTSTPALAPRQGFPAWLVARAVDPWLPKYDPKTDWNFSHASAGAQRACLHSATLPIPKADPPTTAPVSRLVSCNSEALYYGFAGKPDYVLARQCAYLERAEGSPRPVSGSAVLSMIYANGLDVRRSLPLATKFACEAGGAPAEIDARVGHLESLAATTGLSHSRFDFCDDITSGYMEGVCTGVAATYRDGRRDSAMAQIASSYSPTQRAAFSALRAAAADYFNAHARDEVDLSGTARGAFWIEDIEHSWDGFLRDLRALEADQLPSAYAETTRQAEARLNTMFDRVIAQPSLRLEPPRTLPPPGIPVVGGTISREGIRADQFLWLSYRDAWLHFAAVRKPALPRSTVQAWITDQRIRDLRCLLPVHTPDTMNCAGPPILPSNM